MRSVFLRASRSRKRTVRSARTYFVRITGEEGNYYAAEYRTGSAALQGYCLKSQVELVDYVPETPYLDYTIEVVFETEGAEQLPAGFITRYTVEADFYGTFSYGSAIYYYVSLEGDFGYVPATACAPSIIRKTPNICRRKVLRPPLRRAAA